MRRGAAATLALAVLAGCTPSAGVTFEDALTPPPGQAPGGAPFALVRTEGVPEGAGELRAVAAGTAGFVAVGVRGEGGPADEPLVLHSGDGIAWQRVGPAAGLDLVDIAAGPGGFVAVGTRHPADRDVRSAFLFTPDGRAWTALDGAAYGGIEAYVSWVAADGTGFRAGGGRVDGDHARVSWSSEDGRTWQADPEPVDLATPVGAGWLELRGLQVRVRARDGTTTDWVGVEEPPGDPTVLDLTWAAGGRDGLLVGGDVGTPCGPFASCGASAGAWWSVDGAAWRLLPAAETGWSFGHARAAAAWDGSLLVPAGDRVMSSVDGWHWETALEAAGGAETRDIARRDGILVLVGVAWGAGGARTALVVAEAGS